MPARSQRHLRSVWGQDSTGSAGKGSVVTISSPATGASGTAVTLTGRGINDDGGDSSHLLVWSSNQDGALGTGNNLAVTLSVNTHTVTATLGGVSAQVTGVVVS